MKAYIMVHKATGKQVRMSSGKTVWSKAGHAKAALKTSGVCWTQVKEFGLTDENGRTNRWFSYALQDMFEVQEINKIPDQLMDRVQEFVKNALLFIDKADDLHKSGEELLKELSK